MLDAIEHLAKPGIELFDLPSRAKTPQERGIALLEQCGAIRTLVDLIDEFTDFGVILSIESLPRPRLDDQFALVSADLARFITMILQTLTWEDTEKLLKQRLENFSDTWKDAETFKKLAGEDIFSKQEQQWLQEQAGTHPYLLQQFCLHTFHFKRQYAYNYDRWTEIKDEDHKKQLTETFKERLATFFSLLWGRLEGALKESSQKTRNKFADFIREINGKSAYEVVDNTFWNNLGQELHYILRNEGIVRHDPLQRVHYPGSVLSEYLVQKAQQNSSLFTSQLSSLSTGGGYWLMIDRPDDNQDPLPLTEIEYGLLKTL
ncbi:MAG TPA: hypothetical protein VEP90_17190, partial [Methylomirabilota bacterium]|nr:hypothetical protein [Methylomirabilota bacterium]